MNPGRKVKLLTKIVWPEVMKRIHDGPPSGRPATKTRLSIAINQALWTLTVRGLAITPDERELLDKVYEAYPPMPPDEVYEDDLDQEIYELIRKIRLT